MSIHSASSDPLGSLVAVLGILCIGLYVALLGAVVLMRWYRLVCERRERRFIDLWRPLLFESIVEMPQNLPVILASDRFTLLQLYNSIQESIVGEAKDHINVLARRVGIDRVALKLMRRGKLTCRLAAIIAVGNLHEATAKDYLESLLQNKSASLSLVAAHALLRIDPQSAIARIAVLCGSRRDWSPVRVIGMLSEAGAETIAGPLSQVAADAPPDESIRVLGFLEATRCTVAFPIVRDILGRKDLDDRMIVACLRLCAEFAVPEDLPLIRGYLLHQNWCVRLHAVKALGRLGSKEDEDLFISLLEDDNWWVRFRAAQALANFSFMTKARLRAIQAQASSKVQEILAQFVTDDPLRPTVSF